MRNSKGKGEKLKSLTGFLILFFLFLAFADYLRNNTIFFMPEEYKTLKKIVDKIASTNDLKDREIPFTITSGGYTAFVAEELGLCKDDGCYYFANLDPYKTHNKINGIDVNELINQSYLLNGIEAYAWSGTTVMISQSTFQTYGDKLDFFACTIGHELAHIIFNDHIQQSETLSLILENTEMDNLDNLENYLKEIGYSEIIDLIKKGLSFDELKERIELYLSRESESIADNHGARMVINSGFDPLTCLEELTFLTSTAYYPTDTALDDTHPGYIERYKSLEEFINEYTQSDDIGSYKPFKWKWIYNRRLNTLIFKPVN